MSKQSIFYKQKHLHAQKSFTYTQSFYTQTLLRIEACSQSLQTEGLTQRGLYTKQLLHTDAFTQRCTEQLLHTDAPRLLRTEVFTRKLYTDKLLHRETSTQHFFLHRSIYTQTQKLYAHKSFTHTPLHTELLHTDAFTHRSLFTEQGLHRAAFTHQSRYTERERGLCTEQLIQSYAHRNFKHANAQAFTQTGLYT